MAGSQLQTEFEFTLPQGYTDGEGNLHREGRMRLATAADEIEPLQDPRVQSNSSYLTVILLARVVTELGDLDSVNRDVIENLYVADLEHLQAMYERINNQGSNSVETACPDCGTVFEVSAYSGAVVESAGAEPQPEEVQPGGSEPVSPPTDESSAAPGEVSPGPGGAPADSEGHGDSGN
ncbi:MAG: hypothetical protein V5A43_11160 [Haloarculaceae archaeon]